MNSDSANVIHLGNYFLEQRPTWPFKMMRNIICGIALHSCLQLALITVTLEVIAPRFQCPLILIGQAWQSGVSSSKVSRVVPRVLGLGWRLALIEPRCSLVRAGWPSTRSSTACRPSRWPSCLPLASCAPTSDSKHRTRSTASTSRPCEDGRGKGQLDRGRGKCRGKPFKSVCLSNKKPN